MLYRYKKQTLRRVLNDLKKTEKTLIYELKKEKTYFFKFKPQRRFSISSKSIRQNLIRDRSS